MKIQLSITLSLLVACSAEAQTVTLKIKEKEYLASSYPSLSKQFPAKGLRPSDKVTNYIDIDPLDAVGVKPDENRVITLKAAALPYYKLDGLQLYLEPGVPLMVDLKDKNAPDEAVFTGKDADANQWLNQVLFSGYRQSNILGNHLLDTLISYQEYKRLLFHEIDSSRTVLNHLKVNAQFKKDGNARLDLVSVTALLNFLQYDIYFKYQIKTSEDTAANNVLHKMAGAFYWQLHDSLTGDIDKLLPKVYESRFNDLPEVVAGFENIYSFDEKYYEQKQPAQYAELHKMLDVMNSKGRDDFFFSNKINALASSIQAPDLKAVVEKWMHLYNGLQPGQPVIDIALQDTSGKKVMLSSLKGNAMYVDVWATWCGPCVSLKPYFEKLATEPSYSNIAFISISTDRDAAQWRAYVAKHTAPANVQQYIVVDDKDFSNAYQLAFIPRFLLIDKTFKYISALSPTPNDPAATGFLNELSAGN